MRKICLLLILTLLPMVASADKSGKCGANVNYTYRSADKSLTISGAGNMYDFDIYGTDSELPPFPGDAQTIVIESGVTSIGYFAFSGMTQLTSVKIPSTISKINKYSFNGCISVNSISSDIKNPSSVSLGYGVFDDIPTNATLTVPIGTKNRYISASGWKRFNIVEPEIASGKCGANVTYFYERTTHTLSISGNGAMWDLDDPAYYPWHLYRIEIQHVKISSGVTSIEDYAFFGCSGLLTAIIPSSVSSIGMYALRDCSKLQTVASEITNPSNIYDNDIFYGIPSDAILIVPNGLKKQYESADAWDSFKNIIESVFEADGISYKRNVDNSVSVVAGDEKYAGRIVIPCQVTYEGKTYNVTSVSNSAFKDCTELISLYLPEGLKSMGSMMFSGCTSLTCLNIPNSVTYIETGFTNGSSLDKVVIGSGIQKLVQMAIGKKLTTLAVLATTPPDFDVDQFTVDYIYVPKGCITAYKDAWSGPTTDILEIIKGDVNLDGVADETDVDALVSYIMGESPECFFVDLADLNGDNEVDSIDLVKLISIIKN